VSGIRIGVLGTERRITAVITYRHNLVRMDHSEARSLLGCRGYLTEKEHHSAHLYDAQQQGEEDQRDKGELHDTLRAVSHPAYTLTEIKPYNFPHCTHTPFRPSLGGKLLGDRN